MIYLIKNEKEEENIIYEEITETPTSGECPQCGEKTLVLRDHKVYLMKRFFETAHEIYRYCQSCKWAELW
jgi:hypothetical protein